MTASPPQGMGAGAARPRVLVIEDERALTDVLSYNLRREGYEPIVAHDGQEGLRKAQTLLPDLIVLDLMLPVLDGLEVCRELRAGERTRDIPILMLTAKAEETDQVVGFLAFAADDLRRPSRLADQGPDPAAAGAPAAPGRRRRASRSRRAPGRAHRPGPPSGFRHRT